MMRSYLGDFLQLQELEVLGGLERQQSHESLLDVDGPVGVLLVDGDLNWLPTGRMQRQDATLLVEVESFHTE